MILFVDFEASSLEQDSFPIEVAWVAEDGTGETYLIQPAEAWARAIRAGTAWSQTSERIHGIPLDMLVSEGKPAEEVARRALDVLSEPGARPVSDQPNYDGAWLRDLLDAAGFGPVPRLGAVDDVLIECFLPLARLLPPLDDPKRGMAVRDLQEAVSRIMAECANDEDRSRVGVCHRALPDAQSHWRVWRAVKNRAEALLAERRRVSGAGSSRRVWSP